MSASPTPRANSSSPLEVALRTVRPLRLPHLGPVTPGDRFDIPFGQISLPAWSAGEGPTVLLVHGWEGSHHDMSALALTLVVEGYRTVVFDMPAHGAASGRIAHAPLFADAIEAAARAVGPLHGIVGHSLGGAAAAIALARRTWRNPAPLAPNVALIGAPSAYARMVRQIAGRAGLDEHGIDETLRHLETLVEGFARTDAAAWAHRLSDVRGLLVYSPDDRVVPLAEGERLAQAWPEARLELLDGLGHRGIMFAPETQAVVTRFLHAGAVDRRLAA